ncbi:hypothetical protein TsFJ059_009366 [Trichoderma semiorbis]|uniref:BTB domain-containing protein n=1 Tax=Trichoderma semiorbis TaxID=1491008 RepID=A0A9P8KP20_9HYPO|nr:hypothetical protein TsFJ059_009366 [Trichoderma semiorbis]
MDISMQVDLELRLKREEPAEEPEPTDLALTPEPSGPSEPSASANTSEPVEPAELSALEAAKADRAARNAKYRQDIADNNKILAELAEKISKMKRSPSPPATRPLRKKRSHSELLCELILSQMKRGNWKPEDINELLLGPTEEDGDGDSSSSSDSSDSSDSSSSSSSKLKGKFGIGDLLGQLKGQMEGKGKDKGKDKGKEKEEAKGKGKEKDEGKGKSKEKDEGKGIGKEEDDGESSEEDDDEEGEVKDEEKDVTEIICPGGDMFLGIEGSNTIFQVYSQTLMCSSASFEELVEDLMCASGDGEMILILDPENIEIVRIICHIIHLQNHLVPRGFRPSMLLDTAILVNKYGLQKAVTMAARQWLLNGRDFREYLSDPPKAAGCYMVAAALFWDESMFMKCMWELVSICTVPFVRLWAWPPLKQELSQKALKLLTKIRDRARARVYQILLAETGLRCYAGWNRLLQDRYESLLARYKPASMVALPLKQVILEVKRALFRELGGPSSPMDCL